MFLCLCMSLTMFMYRWALFAYLIYSLNTEPMNRDARILLSLSTFLSELMLLFSFISSYRNNRGLLWIRLECSESVTFADERSIITCQTVRKIPCHYVFRIVFKVYDCRTVTEVSIWKISYLLRMKLTHNAFSSYICSASFKTFFNGMKNTLAKSFRINIGGFNPKIPVLTQLFQ